tara:strand:+ start:12878 stop:14758 length:1881 start_codon:yes stop_codon:yes gene_type:complete
MATDVATQQLLITPDPGYLVSAQEFKVSNISYAQNNNSLEFVHNLPVDGNGEAYENTVLLNNFVSVDEPIVLKKITLSDTVGPFLPGNLVKVEIDFEDGWVMPPSNYNVVVDIDGEALDETWKKYRACLRVPHPQVNPSPNPLSVETYAANTSILSYESMYDGGSLTGGGTLESDYDVHYFTTYAPNDPNLKIKLATITLATSTNNGALDIAFDPVPYLSNVSNNGIDPYVGLYKFSVENATQTFSNTIVNTGYTFDLMFTPRIEMDNGDVFEAKAVDDHPWSTNYREEQQYFEDITADLVIISKRVYVPPAAVTGNVYSITTDIVNDGMNPDFTDFWWNNNDYSDSAVNLINELDPSFQVPAAGTDGENTNILITTDNTADVTIDVQEDESGESIDGFPVNIDISAFDPVAYPDIIIQQASGNLNTVKVPISIPPLTGSGATYNLIMTGKNGTLLDQNTGVTGGKPSGAINAEVVNQFKQWPNPTVKVTANKNTNWTWVTGSTGYSQTGRPFAYAEDLEHIPSCSALTMDFDFKVEQTGKTYSFKGAYDATNLVGWDGYYDATYNVESIFTTIPSENDTNNVVIIDNLVAEVGSYARVQGTVTFVFYGNANVEYNIDLEQIFQTN